MAENAMRVAVRSEAFLFEIYDVEQLTFGGYWGSIFQSVLQQMRNSGLNMTVTEEKLDYLKPMLDLERNKTDIEIPFYPQQVNLQISSQVDWGGMTFYDDVHIVSSGSIGASYGPFFILTIFQTSVWLSILGYVIIASFFVGLSRYIYSSLSRSFLTSEILDSTSIVLGLLITQGTEWTPSYVSQRILLITCLFASTTLISMATCNLFSSLSSAEEPNYINNLDDLTSRPELRTYQHELLLASQLWKNSAKATERSAFEQAFRTEGILKHFEEKLDKIVDEILGGKAVFIQRISLLIHFIAVFFELLGEQVTNNYFVHLTEEPVMTELFSVPTRKGLSKSIKTKFYQSILRYNEGGTFNRDYNIGNDYNYYLLQHGHELNIAPKQGMTMGNIILPLIILATGILLSLTKLRLRKCPNTCQGVSMGNIILPLIILANGILLSFTQLRCPKCTKTCRVKP